MKKLLAIALMSAGLTIAFSSCKSDYEKYQEMMNKASNSPVTELESPDGFRFDMTESEFYEIFAKRKSHFTDSLTRFRYGPLIATYDWPLGTEHYAVGSTCSKNFHENKLCSYEIEINGRIVNGKFVWLSESDINAINDYYKAFLEKDYTLDSLNLEIGKSYVYTKDNMAITIHKVSDNSHAIKVKYENRPVTASVEREVEKLLNEEMLEESSVEVKNNKWNGGVKQVEDYLERTLREPDSYESIEWSEVKRKDDGYYVRHKYRAKNGFGGYVITNQLFHLDFNGNVVDVKDLY